MHADSRHSNSRSDTRRRTRSESEQPESELKKALKGAGFGILSGSVLGALLLLLCSGIVYIQPDPDLLIRPAGLLLSMVASVLTGFLAEKKSRGSVPLVGILTGCGFTLLCWLLTIFADEVLTPEEPGFVLLLGRLIQILLGMLGAYLGKNRPKPARKRRRN